MSSYKDFVLPDAPPDLTGEVKAWEEAVMLPTYVPMPADKHPMFLERRVYQGSSGKVYPLPFVDRIATKSEPRTWKALHIENSYLRLMVLPELGGRIHVGLDKTNNYDFFYRQNVIKPALVGLAGPWISGGVELNWPQHHRPATFMPTNYEIESHADGSRTIWCGDHEPMNRLRGMHGICLHPGRAIVELKVRLYNRTLLTQTFLWWANVGVRVHERYQSFLPRDVNFVADHARRAMSRYPLCEGRYYGVDYGVRAVNGIPEEERPRHFVPPGAYPPNDLSWYSNIPVPTSYMAVGSTEDFFGGYDHARHAGLVHVANHHIAPGKKQWTWGNQEFGYAWDRNLTDHDGPYIELMAGVYTDNQPDFSFLAPGETRTFSQYWYPIKDIGPAQKANTEAAISLAVADGFARVGVYATREFSNTLISLILDDTTLSEWTRDLQPAKATVLESLLPVDCRPDRLQVIVRRSDGEELIRFQPAAPDQEEAPTSAKEPPPPEKIKTSEELYLTGLHLDQYRHATRFPEAYWCEALRRDPNDARSSNAMGLWHLRRYEFTLAEGYFRTALRTLTRLNANPYDSEAYYYLGVTLRYLGELGQAYGACYKATWNYAWRAPAFYALAEIDALEGRFEQALDHCRLCLRTNPDHLNVRNLASMILQELGRQDESKDLLATTLQSDPLDAWAKHLSGVRNDSDNQTRLDVAFDCLRAGFYRRAAELLLGADHAAKDGSLPMVLYTLAYCFARSGDEAESSKWLEQASKADPAYCFPSRAQELLILESALSEKHVDGQAAYYLGNLLYDRRRHREAISCWEQAAKINPAFSVVWRNLGIGYFNVHEDAGKACEAFDKAFQADTSSGRVLYERDQLWKRVGRPPEDRLADLKRHPNLVAQRDDLCVELAALYNQTGLPEKALSLLSLRTFQPWEGGEGLAIAQYVRAHLILGRQALNERKLSEATGHFEAALVIPGNLGEVTHPMANRSNIFYWLGTSYWIAGHETQARAWWRKASGSKNDFVEVAVQAYSEMTYYSAMGMLRSGEANLAMSLLKRLAAHSRQLSRQKAQIDYFATSLPAMLLFNDDLDKRNNIRAHFLEAQAKRGLGEIRGAKRLLRKVYELDPNHPMAKDFLEEIECESRLSRPPWVEA